MKKKSPFPLFICNLLPTKNKKTNTIFQTSALSLVWGVCVIQKKRISFEMTFNCSDVCINHSPDLLMTSCFIVQILYYTFEWNNVFCLLSQCCNFDSTSTYVKVTWKCVFEANHFIDHILTSIQNWLQTKHVSGNLLTHPKNKCNITYFRYKNIESIRGYYIVLSVSKVIQMLNDYKAALLFV